MWRALRFCSLFLWNDGVCADSGTGHLAGARDDGFAVDSGVSTAQRRDPGPHQNAALHGHGVEVVDRHGDRGRDGLPREAVHRNAHGQVHHGGAHAPMEGPQAIDLPVLQWEPQGELQ